MHADNGLCPSATCSDNAATVTFESSARWKSFATLQLEHAEGLRLDEDEAVACQFPIYPDPDGFKKFFDNHKALRARLMPDNLHQVVGIPSMVAR